VPVKRLAALLGAAAVLAVLLFLAMDVLAGARQALMRRGMPPAWTVLLRARNTVPPAVTALALPRTEPGDGAAVLWDTTRGLWDLVPMDSAWVRLQAGASGPGDSLLWHEAEEEAMLERWAAAARRTGWDGLGRMLARSDTAAAAHDVLSLRRPDYTRARKALETLTLRGWVRAARGDLDRARADLGAVMGVGEQLLRHEPSLEGLILGRAAVSLAAQGFAVLALRTGDGALAARADSARQWAEASTASSYDVLGAAPDTAFAFARDTTLVLGWRAEAMEQMLKGPLARPRGRLFGLPDRVAARLDTIAAGHDAGAPFAARAAATARRVDGLPFWVRWERYAPRERQAGAHREPLVRPRLEPPTPTPGG
jgi:hypothetical protein